jgi:hypothetical protein
MTDHDFDEAHRGCRLSPGRTGRLDSPSIRSPGHKSDECPNLAATCSHRVTDDRDGIASLVRNCSALRRSRCSHSKGWRLTVSCPESNR